MLTSTRPLLSLAIAVNLQLKLFIGILSTSLPPRPSAAMAISISRSAVVAAAAALVLAASVVSARTVTLSNTALPTDSSGNLLLTGESSVLFAQGQWYVYMNVWGGCAGVDCCDSPDGCAACCFNPPSKRWPDPCVYQFNHTVVAYQTADFETFNFLGEALPTSARMPGIEFRPQVVFNNATGKYVMWYENRHPGETGYAVATSFQPGGPFTTVIQNVNMAPGGGRIGDYDVRCVEGASDPGASTCAADLTPRLPCLPNSPTLSQIFVDDDGEAYHVRTGITIERLNASYTGTSGQAVNIPNSGVEGPSMFKRNGIYYVLVGVGCCACIGGSNVVVYTATAPLGPYTLQGDVGSNSTAGHVFDKTSPYNYVTRAQGSKVVPVPAADGSIQYLWIGNQWVTATQPGHPRDHDLLYFTVLDFDDKGVIQQIVRSDTTTLSLP